MNGDNQDNGIYHSDKNNNNNDKEAYEKAAHVAGKAASEYYAPGVGSKLYNAASKTPIGKGYEKMAGKAISRDKTLGPAAKTLNNLGALDVIDKGIDAYSDMKGAGSEGGSALDSSKSGVTPSSNGASASNGGNVLRNVSNFLGDGKANGKSANLAGDVTGNEEDEYSRSAFSMILDFVNKHKFSLSVAGPSVFTFLMLFLIILVACGGILSAGFLAEDLHKNVSGFFDKLENFVTLNGFVTDQEKVINAKKSFYQKLESVRNDMSEKYDGLQIDVTLIEATLFYNQGLDAELDFADNGNDDQEGDFDNTTKFYKEAKKKVKQLAKMQIIKVITENECSDPVQDAVMDSRSDEEIAREYQNRFSPFEMATKENKIYHAYTEEKKEDGTVTKVCNNNSTETTYNLSVNREGVYYYNLINARGTGKSFIEKYYAEELGGNYSYDDLKEVANDIYDLYEYIRSSSGTSLFASNYASCPNGITVIAGTKGVGHHTNPSQFPIGTFDLEEYVAMVVNGENNSGQVEAMKAQIIAARTYTLARTNNCTKPIRNSTQDQVAKANPSDLIKQLVQETAGMVLMYNGNIFSSEYDSFKGSCNGDRCSGVYTKLPNGEKHTVTIPRSFSEGIGGHGRGMSQCAANYLSSQGQTYEQILKYFYSDGVEISKLSGGSSSLAVANGSAAEKLAFLFPSGVPTTPAQMSQYLVTYPVEVYHLDGTVTTRNITTHKALQADLENIFREIAAAKFPIQVTREQGDDLSCYTWRQMSGASARSHHSYGVACDINVPANPFSKWGASALTAWQPGVNPLSITPDGPVVKAFNNYGWVWGGNWRSSKDYMHFSFTGY